MPEKAVRTGMGVLLSALMFVGCAGSQRMAEAPAYSVPAPTVMQYAPPAGSLPAVGYERVYGSEGMAKVRAKSEAAMDLCTSQTHEFFERAGKLAADKLVGNGGGEVKQFLSDWAEKVGTERCKSASLAYIVDPDPSRTGPYVDPAGVRMYRATLYMTPEQQKWFLRGTADALYRDVVTQKLLQRGRKEFRQALKEAAEMPDSFFISQEHDAGPEEGLSQAPVPEAQGAP